MRSKYRTHMSVDGQGESGGQFKARESWRRGVAHLARVSMRPLRIALTFAYQFQ